MDQDGETNRLRADGGRAERVAWFRSRGYGLFLHWGLYSQQGSGEWILRDQGRTDAYDGLASTFTAADFDARAWVALARAAEMRYAVLTARHHDGFSLYDTRGLSDFDIRRTPHRRDLVAEFVTACREGGIAPFLYHTTLDWRHRSHQCDAAAFARYLDYLHDSVELLCTHYGEVAGFWFDGNWSRPDMDWGEDRLYRMIRRHQPWAILTNNAGLKARGRPGHPELDTATWEQALPTEWDGHPELGPARESCLTMNRHWGLARRDFHYKGPAQIIESLCACRRVGTNLLLNVAPEAQGALPALDAATLRKVGDWVRTVPGEIIRTGIPVAAPCHGRDFLLTADGRLFYFCHDLKRTGSPHVVAEGGGAGPRTIRGLARPVGAVRWLDNGEELRFCAHPEAGFVTVDCTGFPYGSETVVRVAEVVCA